MPVVILRRHHLGPAPHGFGADPGVELVQEEAVFVLGQVEEVEGTEPADPVLWGIKRDRFYWKICRSKMASLHQCFQSRGQPLDPLPFSAISTLNNVCRCERKHLWD